MTTRTARTRTPVAATPAVVRRAALRREITVDPLTPTIGAEIGGIDLGIPPDAAEARHLRMLLNTHKLLVFRDQAIGAAQQLAFARCFGELEVHPVFKKHPEHEEIVVLEGGAGGKSGRENCFHSDVSWREVPSLGSVLRCVVCPPSGGDTIWSDMAAAYEGLSDEVKHSIAALRAVHDIKPGFVDRVEGDMDSLRRRFPAQEHPVVRVHPETGKRALYVNEGFVTHLANFVESDAFRTMTEFRTGERRLLDHLLEQAKYPEYQVRVRWKKDTIAFWDNRSTQHYAVQDYAPARRVMWRITVVGDRPV
jgi:taurine dioxygenase